jgi:hypothetical protein
VIASDVDRKIKKNNLGRKTEKFVGSETKN